MFLIESWQPGALTKVALNVLFNQYLQTKDTQLQQNGIMLHHSI